MGPHIKMNNYAGFYGICICALVVKIQVNTKKVHCVIKFLQLKH